MKAAPEGVVMLELSSDPWQWPELTPTELQALAETSQSLEPETRLFQYFAVRDCNALRSQVEAGSGFAVLAAVRKCGTHGLVMPLWLVYAFNKRYDAVSNFRAISWDDQNAFGKPYPKGTNRNARRKARSLKFAVFNAVNKIRAMEPDTPIDKAIFERVGDPLAIGATLAEEFYYSAKSDVERASSNLEKNGSNALLAPYAVRGSENTARTRKSAGRQRKRR